MVRKRRERTTHSYGIRPYEPYGRLPTERRIVVGGTYGVGERKGGEVNPGLIYQSLRRIYRDPKFIGARPGKWKGKPEKSYVYEAMAGKKGIEQVRKELGQEAIYTEDPRGYYLHGKEGVEVTHYKYVITVRKKAGMDIPAVIRQISSLVGEGTPYETQSTIRFETGLFFGSEEKIIARDVQALIEELRRQGMYATTSVKVASPRTAHFRRRR